MARIRTVKPELWTDEKIVECSFEARLLFIGLFNFSDDNGNMVNSPKRIKMQVFPADVIDCKPLIDELLSHGLLISYDNSGVMYLNIKGFKKHQYVKNPAKAVIPTPEECGFHIPALPEDSPSATPALPEDSHAEGKGMEGKGKDKEICASENTDAPNKTPPTGISCDQVIDAFHRILPELPHIRALNDKRKNKIRTFWKKAGVITRQLDNQPFSMQAWEQYLEYISHSCRWMLEDRENNKSGTTWHKKNLEYLLDDAVYLKVREGNHDDR